MASRTQIGRRATRGALVAVVVVAASLVAAPAQAARETCGLTVTSDYTLRSNLRCSGTAITVELSDPGQVVTLDLGHHALFGDGTGSGVYVNADAGSGTVVVRNGQIRGFASAVDGYGTLDLTLQDLTVRDNGVWLAPGAAAVLTLTVEGSRIVDSGVSGAYTESTTTVRHSDFVRSGIASPAETYTYVYDSTFVGGGVSTGYAANIVAERNRFSRCDVGLAVYDSWPASPTVVRDNTFERCRVGAWLSLGMAGSGANGVTVEGNEFRHNAEEGLTFTMLAAIGEVAIIGNRATGNGGAGIAGTGAGVVTVADNTALRNGGHGIDVSDVIDGGGNVAWGNATPPQCIGVVCSDGR